MSYLSIKYFSRCLNRPITFTLILPHDYSDQENGYCNRPRKTLMLLHGYTGDGNNWIPEELAKKYNFVIVIPSAENGFWLDGISTGHKYESLIAEEIIAYIRKNLNLAQKSQDTYIMGLSMGGFGALHTALAHPDVFGRCTCLSSALICYKLSHMKPGDKDEFANYEYYRECFGDLEKLDESRNNPEVLVKEILEQKKPLPKIILTCGTEDFLLEPNRRFHKFLLDNKVEHTYWEAPGNHDMDFWNECVKKFIPQMFE